MFDTCLILKLIGYFIGCGKLKDKKNIIFKNSENKLNKIEDTLNMLNIKHKISINSSGLFIDIYDKFLFDFLSMFGYKETAHIPRRFLNLDKRYLRYLLECLFDSSTSCDVEITKDYELKSRLTPAIVTLSRMLTDNIHELIIKLCFCFNTTIAYGIPVKRKQYDPITCYKSYSLDTRLLYSHSKYNLAEVEVDTTIYNISAGEKFRLIPIRNSSKHLWINV